jgi:hypothetical protein
MRELAARNGAERAVALNKLTERLTSLIEEETRLFDEKRPHEALRFQSEKSDLATIYRHEVSLAGRDKTRFAGATPAARQALRRTTERFHDALARNGQAVQALKTITEGVVKAVADEAQRRRENQAGYGPGAAQRTPQGSLPAVAIDRTA